MKDHIPWHLKALAFAGICLWLGGAYVVVHFVTKYW